MFQSANVSSDSSSKKSWSPMTQSSFATRSPRQSAHSPVADQLRPLEVAVPRSAPQVTFCVRGVISPCLSNIFLHHVLDEWFENEVKPRLRGECVPVRFADDALMA